jgi:hypothetical protein
LNNVEIENVKNKLSSEATSNETLKFLASQLIIMLKDQLSIEDKASVSQNAKLDSKTTRNICSLPELVEQSTAWRDKLDKENELSALSLEFQKLSNWFAINQIELEDLEDEQTFSPVINEEMNIIEMRAAMLKYVECISSTGIASLSTTSALGVTHVIELTEEKPFRDKYRQVPHNKREEFNKYLHELATNGFIVESKSNYSSCPNVLLKPDGSVCFTIDYKKINSLTKKDNYPLPVIDNLFKDMVGCTFFSKKDLDSGYYQCLMDPASQKYTAFSCELGLFEWTRMPMGLKNSGCTFQRMMDKILRPLIGKVCHVYQDDVIVFC